MSNYKLAPFLVLVTFLCVFIMWVVLPLDVLFSLISENGPIENMTIVFYFLVIISIWFSDIKCYSKPITRITSTLAILALIAREADLHKVIEGTNVLKVRFWISDFSITYKLAVAAVILPMAFSILYLCAKFWQPVLKEIKQQVVSAISLATFFMLLVITKILDRSVDIITQLLSWDSPRWVTALQNALEEPLEMLLPILLLIFIFQKVKEKSS